MAETFEVGDRVVVWYATDYHKGVVIGVQRRRARHPSYIVEFPVMLRTIVDQVTDAPGTRKIERRVYSANQMARGRKGTGECA